MTIKTKVSRRAVLRGAGGVTLGLPWLEMTAGRAHAQQVGPKRLLLISLGHSMSITKTAEHWMPSGAHGSALPTDLSPLLSPLVPNRDKLLVVGGIDNVVAPTVPSNGHNFSSRSLLTCMPTKNALDANKNLLATPPSCETGHDAAGPSFEYVVANAWKDTGILNLRTGESPGEHVRSFRMDASRDDGNPSPVSAFDRLLGGKPAGMTRSGLDRLRGNRKSILDGVLENFNGVVAKAGRDDRVRLQRHADHIRQFEGTLSNTIKIVCDSPKLNPPSPLPTSFTDGSGRTDDVIAATHLDLAATAFACQATRVAHIHFSNIQENTFPWLNNGQPFIPGGWHGIVHIDTGTDAQRMAAKRWYMKFVNDAITKLAQTAEGSGNLLTNTLVVVISSLRLHWHSTGDLPIIVAGNLGGTLKTGRLLKYTRRSLGDFYTTLLNLLDIPTTSFGWNKGMNSEGRPFNTGPLADWT